MIFLGSGMMACDGMRRVIASEAVKKEKKEKREERERMRERVMEVKFQKFKFGGIIEAETKIFEVYEKFARVAFVPQASENFEKISRKDAGNPLA